MNKTFILNHSANRVDLKDAIHERLTKIHAISNCLLAARSSFLQLEDEPIYNAIWAIDDYLDEIAECQKQLSSLKKQQ